MNNVQQATNMSRAMAALFTLITLSNAMQAYPVMKTATIAIVNISYN